ncbi:hypoxanthine phosphoribosyltransferase [Chloroflexota bacterium]
MDYKAELQVLISRQEVAAAVERLAVEITKDYKDKKPLLIGILKGSFMFMSDLIKLLDFPLEVEFITLSSYGRGRSTPGELKMVKGLRSLIKDRHVLIVEDIVDHGHTITFLKNYLQKKKPSSLKLCVLTDKPSRRKVPVTIDYLGFTIPDKFIVGYGIDWDEKYRNLPDICFVEVDD